MSRALIAPPRTATIVVYMQPPPEVSPNYRGHTRSKARRRAVAEFRQEAGMAAMVACSLDPFLLADWGGGTPVVLDAEIAWCCGRKSVDPTNAPALLKAAIDGIADVLWDGHDDHVLMGTVTQRRGEGVVTVTLREPS